MIQKKLQKALVHRFISAIIAVMAMLSVSPSHAQYYSWGADPTSLKWQNIRTPYVRLIYPDTIDALARRTLTYIDAAKEDISHGFTHPALKIPFIMHPENFSSNGLVMWLPKRIEFLTSPAVDSYSMPWLKQLAAHEYRHAVQYNNLNRGVVRVLSYPLGEQGSALGLLFLPLYIIEGDAVMCETQMSSFGRALQPSFTMAYRAIGRDMLDRRNLDRWFCGSYLGYTPDHYELGYQAVSYAYTYLGDNVWDRVAAYGVRNPYVIATVSTALNKYYDINSAKLVRAAFTNLFDHWDSLPARENSTEVIATIDTTNYTTYSHPMPYGSKGDIVSLKEDYVHPSRFVLHKASGDEERIAYTGNVSTRPSLGEKYVWWSEYRRSTLFDQRVNSQLCYMNIEDGKPHAVRKLRNVLYPTVIDESNGHIAYVEYLPNGQYSIIEIEIDLNSKGRDTGYREISRTPILFPTEVHGLAWDDQSRELYFIATDDSGMWLGARDKNIAGGFRQLQKGAYITLSDLRANGGKLYYGSIESGYDELHSFDIATGTECRITESTYGSFDASQPKDGYIYATTYDRHGYHLAKLKSDDNFGEVEHETLPQNIVNPERVDWDLINLDLIKYTPADSIASHANHKARRYNKAIKIINAHSWMPVATNPFELSEENRLYVSAGATIMSQNLLSTAEGYASYGYNSIEGSLWNMGLIYGGLGVDLEVEATYGGNQVVYDPFQIATPHQQTYYSVSTKATLPLTFSGGYRTRQLWMSALWNYTNGLVLDLDRIEFDAETGTLSSTSKIGFSEGLQKMSMGIGYYNIAKSAMRDLATPSGYSVSVNYALSPSEENFSDLLVLYGKLYTRGFAPYNSFSIEACYQNAIGGYKYNGINLLSFQSAALLPEGFSSGDIINNHYTATSLDYQFPIWYPEGGIGSILYFRRVRLGAGFDAARFKDYYDKEQFIYAYGANLIVDINTMRLPESGTTAVEMSLFRNNFGNMSFQFGMVLPF